MGYFTQIYIVTIEDGDKLLKNRCWFWDRTEANDMYDGAVDEYEDTRIVTLYSIDVQDTINARVDELMANRHSSVNRPPLEELRSSRKATEPVEDSKWGELEFRPDGEFYIELTKESTSEYWPYRVEAYGNDSWRVIDATTDAPIGIIRQGHQNEAWRTTVNGYSHSQPFTGLKAAVIHIATEYNG